MRFVEPVHADNVTEVAGAARLHAGRSVLEHRGLVGADAGELRAGEELIRGRLPGQMLLVDGDAVDAVLDEAVQSGHTKDLRRIRAR